MSNISRRELLRNAAVASIAGSLSAEAAQGVHAAAQADKDKGGGAYKPKAFNAHEWSTLRRLCELIIPADEKSKSALDAGAPEFIDLLASHNDELTARYTGGILWLDNAMQKRAKVNFVDATGAQQTELLDLIAYRKNAGPDTSAGIRFFDLVRKMTADAYYTSKVGIADLGYMGNKGMSQFHVPVEAVQLALKKSGLG